MMPLSTPKLSDLAKHLEAEKFLETNIENYWNVLIPENQRWRLTMDKDAQINNDPEYFDKNGLNDHPPENGYAHKMQDAFNKLLVNIETPISPQSLIDIHTPLRIFDYGNGYQEPRVKTSGYSGAGYIFYIPGSKYGPPSEISPALQQEWRECELIFDPQDPENKKITSAADIPKNYLAVYFRHGSKPKQIKNLMHRLDEPVFKKLFKAFPKKNGSINNHYKRTNQRYKDQIINHTNDYNILVSRTGFAIHMFSRDPKISKIANHYKTPFVQGMLDQYTEEINAAGTDDKKLLAIVRVIQKLSVMHPFADYNQRTFVFLLLNKLLMQNDFLPVILDNPFVFDGFVSLNNLVKEVKIGFNNFLTTIHGLDNNFHQNFKDSLSSSEIEKTKLPVRTATYTTTRTRTRTRTTTTTTTAKSNKRLTPPTRPAPKPTPAANGSPTQNTNNSGQQAGFFAQRGNSTSSSEQNHSQRNNDEPRHIKTIMEAYEQLAKETYKDHRRMAKHRKCLFVDDKLPLNLRYFRDIKYVHQLYTQLNDKEFNNHVRDGKPFLRRERVLGKKAGMTRSWKKVLKLIKDRALAIATANPEEAAKHQDLYQEILNTPRGRIHRPEITKSYKAYLEVTKDYQPEEAGHLQIR